MMGNIMFPNASYTVGLFINANSIIGKIILCVCYYAHITVSQCESECVYEGPYACVCISALVCVGV